jgi:hypothetical protein
MEKTTPSTYRVVLPAVVLPAKDVNTHFRLNYLFLVVSNDLRVTIIRPYWTDIIADTANGKPTGHGKIDTQAFKVFTETNQPVKLTGFYGGLTAMPVALSDRFGLLIYPLLSDENLIKAGGIDTIIRETGAKSVDYYDSRADGAIHPGYGQIKAAFKGGTPISNAVVNGDAVVAAIGELAAEKAACNVRIIDSVILGGLDFTKIKASSLEGTILPDDLDEPSDIIKKQKESAMDNIRVNYGNNASFRYIPCKIIISQTDIHKNGLKKSIIANNTIFTEQFTIVPRAAGEVFFDRCFFLDKFTMVHTYRGEVSLSNSVFYSTLKIGKAFFHSPVRLAGLTLFSSLEVGNSNFFRRFDVEGSFLKGSANIYGNLFTDNVSLNKSVINGHVSLNSDLFRDMFSINNSTLNKNLYINRADFRKGFAINNSRIAGDGIFAATVSHGAVVLKDITISGRTDFSGVTAGGLEVERSVFSGSVSFSGARLGQTDAPMSCGKANRHSSAVTFREVFFGSDLVFTRTQFLSDTVFDGVRTAKKTDFSLASFPLNDCGIPSISFRRNDFDKLKVHLYQLPHPDFFKYMQDSLQMENRIDEAASAHYLREKAEALRALTGEARAVDAFRAVEWLFWGAPTGYGRFPQHVLFSAFVCVLFFALFYFSMGCLRIGMPPHNGRRRLLEILNYPADASPAGVPGNGAGPSATGGGFSFAADFAAALLYSFSIFFKVGRPGVATYGICRWAALCQWYAGFIALAAFIRCIAARFGI